jgi:hypothetical protein
VGETGELTDFESFEMRCCNPTKLSGHSMIGFEHIKVCDSGKAMRVKRIAPVVNSWQHKPMPSHARCSLGKGHMNTGAQYQAMLSP